MKKNYLWFMVVIVFVAGLMISNMLAQAEEVTPVIQWEYKTVTINYMSDKQSSPTLKRTFPSVRILSKDLSILNEHGKDGWELCGVNRVNYYLKREIRK